MENISSCLMNRIDCIRSIDKIPVVSGCSSGYEDLDAKTGGFFPKQLVAISGVPGIGKSSFALSMLLRMCRNEQPTSVAYYSMETSKEAVIDRLTEIITGRKIHDIPNMTDEDWESLRCSLSLEDNLSFFIEDEVFVYEEFKTQITHQVRKYGIQYVCIDALQYLKLLDKSQKRSNERDLHYIMFDLKRLAQQLNITIFVISNNVDALNIYDVIDETKIDHWQLQDGDEGACSVVADIFLQLHRPEYYDIFEDEKGNDLRGLLQIFVRKNRFGSTGRFYLRFRNTTGSVKNLDEYDIDELKKYSQLRGKESAYLCDLEAPF